MALFKCKMCGGTLEIAAGTTVIECEYCGTQQTLPKLDDNRKANLYDRANHFRRNNEFDKAMGIYEQILNEDNTDAEAYWSLVLCRYGIEYVEDPSSHKRVPTVNRAQFTSIYDDDNYKSALQYADSFQKAVYEAEAKAINEIQKGILEISQKEEPFDVFICYKESDNNGRRTPDSVLANDLYHQLTQEGFKVFFARITLEDKLGSAYEPYIFAALNSAKVMVVLGTKPEYFSAVWVKNEWSRYLALIKQGQKKMLIPAYKDMDPYDLPEEFSHLQAQDMSKLGFMQDLIRGIKKIAQADEPKATVVKETIVSTTNPSTAPLLKRAFMFLEDGDWRSANEYCEKVLDIDPENAQAYVGKLMAELHVKKQSALKDVEETFADVSNYQKALRFADDALKSELEGYIDFIINRNLTNNYNDFVNLMNQAKTEDEYKSVSARFKLLKGFKDAPELAEKCLELAEEARLTDLYDKAVVAMGKSTTESEYKATSEKFAAIKQFKDAEALAQQCLEKAEIARKDARYNDAVGKAKSSFVKEIEEAIRIYESIPGWKDSAEQIENCKKKIADIKAKEEADRIAEEERKAAERKEAERLAKRNKMMTISSVIAICVIIVSSIIVKSIVTTQRKNAAIEKYGTIVDNANVGDTILFGAYEQDNNLSNGKEDVEWIVLEKQENKVLVISKYALDCKPYNTRFTDVTWATCTLRDWVNNEFVSNAFSKIEQAVIPTVSVSADKNPEYNTNPGNATQDKVFLLSITEVNKYFKSDDARKCKPTAYAVARGAAEGGNGNCRWWLRSPGFNQYVAAYVCRDGDVLVSGDYVNYVDLAVRPALWIDLNS